jgi:hypothetical protein
MFSGLRVRRMTQQNVRHWLDGANFGMAAGPDQRFAISTDTNCRLRGPYGPADTQHPHLLIYCSGYHCSHWMTIALKGAADYEVNCEKHVISAASFFRELRLRVIHKNWH